MDYVEGRSLAEVIREKPLAAHAPARYVHILALAVHYAHRRGILHRDLKPSNILIDADDQPRIADFGLAKHLAFEVKQSLSPVQDDTDLTLSGQALGSPNYMPPEQAAGRRADLGPPSDVHSLGAIF